MSLRFWDSAPGKGRRRSFFQPRARNTKPARRLRLESLEARAMLSATTSVDTDTTAIARIINGAETSGWEAVGKIGSSSEGYYGSGVLVGSKYVLTAGHCGYGLADNEGIFYINGTRYTTSDIIVHSGYNENAIGTDRANDIAVFVLSQDVAGVTPSAIYEGTPEVGDELTLVGYGYGGTGATGSDYVYGTKREGTTDIEYVSATLIGWTFDYGSDESNTAPGDSGSPAYIYENGSYYVAGICSCGTDERARWGDSSYDTRVDAYADWLNSIVGEEGSTLPTVGIAATDAAAAETASGSTANTGRFTITRSETAETDLTIYYTISGTATNGADYTTIAQTATIPAGSTSTTVEITPIDDSVYERSETVKLTLLSNSSYTLDSAKKTATVTIADNDSRPTVRIVATDATAAETASDATANTGLFTITRTGSTAAALTVAYTVTGTATNGADYTTIARTATIPAGSSSTTIEIKPIDDSTYESTETVTLTLASSTSYAVSSSQKTATVSITDNDTSSAPVNDNFAARIAMSAGTVTGSNVGATRESGEPYNANVVGGKSVWWTWTATASGRVTISTAGSSFDTTLGVYTGTSVRSLSRVASNDDANYRAGILTSQVSFNAVAGRTYQISVDGYRGASGSIQLTLTQTVRSAYSAFSTASLRNASATDAVYRSLAQLATLY